MSWFPWPTQVLFSALYVISYWISNSSSFPLSSAGQSETPWVNGHSLIYLALILIIFIPFFYYYSLQKSTFLKNFVLHHGARPVCKAFLCSNFFFLGEEKRRGAKEGYTCRPMYYTTTLLANPVSSTTYLFIYTVDPGQLVGGKSSPELTVFISTGKLTAK